MEFGAVFRGEVRYVRVFPFTLKKWEREIMYQSYRPVVEVLNAGTRTEMVLPRWFEAWLSLRTTWAKLKRYGK